MDTHGDAREEELASFRRCCQDFSNMGWALFALLAGSALVQTAAVLVCSFVPGLSRLGEAPLFSWGLAIVSTYGVGFGLFCLILRRRPAPVCEPGKPLGPARMGQALVISVAALYLFNFISLALLELIGALRGRAVGNPVEQMLDYPLWCNLILMCIVAPVCEEIMFRRLLLNRLRPYGDAFAVAASALAFALLHGNLSQYFYAFSLGCVFGYVALRTGRIRQTIVLHACINAISAGIYPMVEALWGDMGLEVTGLLVLALTAQGIIFFIALRREIRLSPGACPLEEGRKWRVLLTSPGFVIFLLASAAEAALTLTVM